MPPVLSLARGCSLTPLSRNRSQRFYAAFRLSEIMSKTQVLKPETSEYAEYFGRYVGRVPNTDIVEYLQQQLQSTMTLFASIGESKGDYRYEEGKWSIKELIGHIIDGERVFAYRALVFARNDTSPLPGFDQDPWMKHANYANL